MTAKQVLAELKALGTEQNRKIYRRHAGDPDYPVFGVSFANLYALRKRIKQDHALALELWASGIIDARVLALYIADSGLADAALLERWAGEVTDYGLADAFGDYAASSADGVNCALKWIKDKREFVQRCGWNVLGTALKNDANALGEAHCRKLLAQIEKTIHKAPNRAREGMNYMLIALGTYRPGLRDEVLAAAGRIGPVHVDHGETGCKQRDAAEYIMKAVAKQKQKAV